MATSFPSPVYARFNGRQVDLASGVVRKSSGAPARLQQKPLQVLRLLLEAEGRIVTREQLRAALWPENTFVDFEHSVNTAVSKLRQALEDSGENPRLIETLPKVGYRFMVPVTWEPGRIRVVPPPARVVPLPIPAGNWRKNNAEVTVAAAVMVAAAALLAYSLLRPARVPSVSNYVQLTHDGHPKWLVGTDGTRLYLGFGSPDSNSGIGQISIKGGEPRKIPTPPSTNLVPLEVSADGSELLVVDGQGEPYHGKLWSLPVVGGELRPLGDAEGRAASWSPDGKSLAYSNGSDFFLAQGDGSEPRKLAVTKVFAEIDSLIWSPDGSHLRIQATEGFGKPMVLWEVSTQGGDIHRLVPGPINLRDDFQCCGRWTPDGRYFVFSAGGQIWALPRKGRLLHSTEPIQLTSSPMWLATPVPSKDGKKLFVNGFTRRGELLRYESGCGQFVPFLGGISAEFVDFSKDGQWVAYVSYPEGVLWRSRADGSERLQLAPPREFLLMPHWSLDGRRVVFYAVTAGKAARIYEVSAEGGTPRELMPDDPGQQFDPNYSPDGSKIVFGGAANDPASTIRVLDLKTRQVSTLPGSQGFFSPRWSPDGRYIVALTFDTSGLELFDFQTGKWTELAKGILGPFPNWSKDGQFVYALAVNAPGKVLRVRISGRKVEEVADMKTFTSTGSLALAPDDSILVLRDTGTDDVYGLDWEER